MFRTVLRSAPPVRFGTGLLLGLLIAAGSAWAQDNVVGMGSASGCVTTLHPCVTLPVQIARTDATPLFAYSVTLTLSPELALCAPEIVEGDYLSSVSATSFQVRDLGGGTYTVDGTILGAENCGAVAASGRLFDVHVTNAAGNGTGAVTISSLLLRDCSNEDLVSTVGDAGSVTIDLVPITLDPIADPTVAETAMLVVTPSVTASSCAGGPLGWSATGLPSGASIDPSTGVVTWTPGCTAYESGPDYGPVTITVEGSNGESASQAFTIHVSNSPGSVTATVTPPAAVEELAPLSMDPPVASLQGCAAGPVSWSIDPAPPAGASFDGATGVITWTPGCGTVGTYGPFTLTATAATGESDSGDPFTLDVTHRSGTVSVVVGASFPVEETSALSMAAPEATLTACASGPVTWSVSPALPAGATLGGDGIVAWTPVCGQAGSYGPFTLTAHAATGEEGSGSFSLVVTHRVGAVDVAAISDPTVAEGAALLVTPSASLTACATGPLTWSATGLPSGASLDPGTGEVSWTPDCAAAEIGGGVYGPVELHALAVTGEEGTVSFTIHVTDTPGTVTIAALADPQTVAEMATLTVTPSLTLLGCARAPVTWSATGLPAGATLDASTGVVTWNPDCAAHETNGGHYGPVMLTATAFEGESASRSFSIDVTNTPVAIAAVSALGAAQVRSANGGSSLTGISVQFTAPSGATSIEVYRAPFGNYPEYDDGASPGSAPAAPGYPPSAPWTLTDVVASGQVDHPATRDVWYYVAFARNACGDVSPVSVRTGGTLDYHLGDVSDGATPGLGDDSVNTADISQLGAHYGLVNGAVAPFAYLDVGPTTTGWIDGRPETDDHLDFEDLVIFAINYGQVSAPQAAARPVPLEGSGSDELSVAAPATVAAGGEVAARLDLRGSGRVRALSARLAWNPAVVEPLGQVAGDWLTANDGVAFSSEPGVVDVATLSGRLAGEGTLATITFHALAAGDPQIRLAAVEARDDGNHSVPIARGEVGVTPSAPLVTALARAVPNPFDTGTRLGFSLVREGRVDLAIHSVDGRRVRTLLAGPREAGEHHVVWDGTDDSGHRVGSGVYYVRLSTPQGRFTRTITYLR